MKPTRLVISIYLMALAQLLTAWLGFSLSRDYLIEPPGRQGVGGWEVFAAQHVAFDRETQHALRETMEWLRVELGIRVTLFDPTGRVLASNHTAVPRPLAQAEVVALPVRSFLPGPTPDTLAVGIHDGDKLVAYVITDRFQYRRPISRQVLLAASVLLVLLTGSLLFARSLAVPLRRLAGVARAFGMGHLDARANLNRRDELGAVAQAFDDMADRVTALLRSERELLANVSHELRTPLARIRVALDLATEGDADAARDALTYISTDWGDLDRLVEDVLASARLDLGSSVPGGLRLQKDQVILMELADATATRYQVLYPGERLDLDLPPDLPPIEADASLLRRVLDNLVDNARKYSEPKSAVALRARREPGGLCITVIDQGMGIEAADLPHIFTPFFRADRSRTRKTGGVGMGLTLVRRIVTAHGGRVEVESQVARGTKMHVHLPSAFRDPSSLATSTHNSASVQQPSRTGSSQNDAWGDTGSPNQSPKPVTAGGNEAPPVLG